MPDIKVRYVVDYDSITQARAALHDVTKEEKDVVDQFKKINEEAKKAGKSVDDAGNKGKESMSGFEKAAKSVGGAIVAVFAVEKLIEFGAKVISITSEFQKYEAVLKNTLGSATAAAVAQQSIVEAAAKTNFSVQELTDTYIKFANRGVKLTNSELLKLTDIANSTGKSIDQLTEAALDSFTGENERLKEFGITAKKAGDIVKFTFKTQTTEVKNTQEAIKAYILSLGDLEGVAGSTAAISQTLGGQISNLGDSFDQLFLTIGKGSDGPLSFIIVKLGELTNAVTRALKTNEQLREEAANREAGAFIEQFATMDAAYQNGQEALLKRQIEISEKATERLVEARKAQAAKIRKAQEAAFGYSSEVEVKKSPEELRLEQNIATKKKELELIAIFFKDKAAKEAADNERQLGLIESLEKKLKELETAQKQAFSRDAILKFEDEIELTRAKLADLFRVRGESVDPIKGILPDIKQMEVATNDVVMNEQVLQDKLNEIRDIQAEKDKERLEKVAQNERDLAEEKKRIRQEEFELGVQLVNALFEINANSSVAEQQRNEAARAQELKRVGDDKQAQAFINNKFDKQQAALKTKQAEADKAQALFNVVIGTAMNIVKVFPNPVLIALAAAAGAIQAAVIASRPIPKFREGTELVEGPGTSTSDSILARLSAGERVVPAHINKMLEGIPNADLPKLVAMNYEALNKQVSPQQDTALYDEVKGLRNDLKRMPVNQLHFDERGFKKFIMQGDSVTEILNNNFPR